MTENSIRDSLVAAFMTLNNVSGKDWIKRNDKGEVVNVAMMNRSFTPPSDKRYFALHFLSNSPTPAALMEGAQDRFTGFFQIDIITPKGAGEAEADAKYEALRKIFRRGKCYGDAEVIECHIEKRDEENDCYKTIVRVEWTADIDA